MSQTPHPLAMPSPQAARDLATAGAPAGGLEELMGRPLSEADLDRATAELAAPLDDRSGGSHSLLMFRRGGEMFAVAAAEAAKVVNATTTHRVPHRSNQVFRGIANHDGEILLCMALEAALGLPAAEAHERPKLVVVGAGRDRWAFEVDAIEGVLDVPEAAFRPAPVTVTAARSGCVRALAASPHGEAVVLDLPRLFSLFRGALG